MVPTFYEYITRFVDYEAKDPMSRLANTIHQDITFPKRSTDFNEVSTHLEHSVDYGKLMTTFDDAWSQYQAENF